jgi:ring-1,2-phenylacetyl-CoA epoxidase subunit PaaD
MEKYHDLGRIWKLLEEIKDPEIPVISIVDLGIIRSVGTEAENIVVTISPTFIGCPALHMIQQEIVHKLQEHGFEHARVNVTISPPWSSDWITSEGRKRLKEFGLSPPPKHDGDLERAISEIAHCPYCDSERTTLKSSFGPTLCRAIYYCNNCLQPFEQFKPI